MGIERGSTWNKWDFHVHTPYSLLNNQFGFDPDPNYQSDVDEFDEYVRTLFTKAVEKKVVAIGITDYFSVDGYKRIRKEYLEKPEKMKELFPDDEMRALVEKIYVFPNIELRLDTFVGEKKHSVNYHVLFAGETECEFIEERFLHRLSFLHHTGTKLPVTRSSIIQLGREYKQNNPKEKGDDYRVGLEKAVIHHTEVIEVLNNCSDLADKFYLAIPVDEDLSELKWDGRYSETRRILYSQCHLLFSSSSGTRKFALAEGHEEAQKKEFGSIKPCVWGSDAHSYDRMFCPDKDRFCWIKAEPTLEGFQQILYEPAERVRIQKEKPEEKDEHHLIDYIIFHDDSFEDTPVYLSEGLTAIIGGKSTGKSILLRHIAKCADAKQVEEKEREVFGTRQKLDVNAEIYWKDGVSGERKIIYIPQSWLNRVVDESGGDTQLNKMIRDILLQQTSIFSAHGILRDKVNDILFKTKKDIEEYVSHVSKANACEKILSEYGCSDAFKSSIKKLEKKRDDLSTEAGITEEILEKYSDLERTILEQEELRDTIIKEETQVDFLEEPYLYVPRITKIELDDNHTYDLSGFPTIKGLLENTIWQVNTAILDIWAPAIEKASTVLAEKKTEINDVLDVLRADYEPLKKIVAKNDQLKKIDNQLKEEKQRLSKALDIEQEKSKHQLRAEELKQQILASRNTLYLAYSEFSQKLKEINAPDTDLVFEARIEDRKQELYDALYGLFDNRNLKAFRDSGYSFTDVDTFKIDDGLFEVLWEGMSSGTLGFRGGNNLQSALDKLFSDWNYVHYVVSSGNDTINDMSPGKKALVLLELIVNLEKGNCPILIDQPEDDLDNRSIYTDLVKYLKDKKHERQIIVVTHNANVVVGADSEEVIIANQAGKESENYSKRFEYRCGPIENVSPVYTDGRIRKGVLNQKGIQQQICDILEGGKDAFEKRQKKYFKATKAIL